MKPVQSRKSINVVDADVDTFKELDARVHLTAQMVPGDTAADFMSLLKKDRGSQT